MTIVKAFIEYLIKNLYYYIIYNPIDKKLKMSDKIKLQISDTNNLNNISHQNKPFNEKSTTDEIQNIFKKIRKKNKTTSTKTNLNINKDDEFKDILKTNNQNKKSLENNFEKIEIYSILMNIISFNFFYLSFEPITNYFFLVNIFIFPMEYIQFIFCVLSGIITAGIITLIILKKLPGYHLLYMIFYFIFIFFLHHYKFIGSSHFDQSFIIFYEFIAILIHTLCILFIIYFLVKYYYYKGKLKKNNIFVKLFVSRWNSSERIKRSEHDSLLNDKNLNFVFKRNKLKDIKPCFIILFLFLIQIFLACIIKVKKNEIFSCENIDIGLNGTHILYKDNLKNQCHIKKPEGYCYMDYFKYYFDLTPINNINCSLRAPIKEKKNFLINLENNNDNINYYTSKKFAFPHTNLDSRFKIFS